MSFRHLAADLVRSVHLALVAFVALGCLLPRPYLRWHLLAFPLLLIHWRTNHNRCAATQLEYWLRGESAPVPDIDHDHDNAVKENRFVRHLLSLMGFSADDQTITAITYYVFLASYLISWFRLFAGQT